MRLRPLTLPTDPPRLPPGAMLVIPPRSVVIDELRLARLGLYLEAEFPSVEFVVADNPKLAGRDPAVGLAPRKDGKAILSDPETKALLDSVLSAVERFVSYGQIH